MQLKTLALSTQQELVQYLFCVSGSSFPSSTKDFFYWISGVRHLVFYVNCMAQPVPGYIQSLIRSNISQYLKDTTM